MAEDAELFTKGFAAALDQIGESDHRIDGAGNNVNTKDSADRNPWKGFKQSIVRIFTVIIYNSRRKFDFKFVLY